MLSLLRGDFAEAAARFDAIGSRPDAALARLRAGEALVAAGRREAGLVWLREALAFFAAVGAKAQVREIRALGSAAFVLSEPQA